LGEFYRYVFGIVVPFWGLGRINVGISLGAFDAILMGVFWLNYKLGVGFVGMWLDDFWWFWICKFGVDVGSFVRPLVRGYYC
jgi:hypothetical protein